MYYSERHDTGLVFRQTTNSFCSQVLFPFLDTLKISRRLTIVSGFLRDLIFLHFPDLALLPGPLSDLRLRPLPFFPHNNGLPPYALSNTQNSPTCQTLAALRRTAKDAQTDRANIPHANDVSVAETGGAEVDVDSCRKNQMRLAG